MGIENLRMAVNAAGYAMANSEELLTNAPISNKEECGARLVDPRGLAEESDINTAQGGGLREWWLFLSGKEMS
jgi:hypothetical protein